MKHFKNEDNQIFGYDDGQVTQGFGADLIAVTDAEAKTINTNRIKLKEQKIFDSLNYAEKRAESYDSVGDQLDQIMKDMKNGTTTHRTACEAVKIAHPKPE